MVCRRRPPNPSYHIRRVLTERMGETTEKGIEQVSSMTLVSEPKTKNTYTRKHTYQQTKPQGHPSTSDLRT